MTLAKTLSAAWISSATRSCRHSDRTAPIYESAVESSLRGESRVPLGLTVRQLVFLCDPDWSSLQRTATRGAFFRDDSQFRLLGSFRVRSLRYSRSAQAAAHD